MENTPLCSGAFHQRGPEDGIYLPILDEVLMFVYGLKLLLHFDLRGQPGVEDELSEISFVDQVLEVPSEGAIVHCVVAPPIVKGIVVSRSRSLPVL